MMNYECGERLPAPLIHNSAFLHKRLVPSTEPLMSDLYVTKPKVYLVGRQSVVEEEMARFLQDEGVLKEARHLFLNDRLAPHQINFRSEEHTSELQSRLHIVC